MGGRLEDATCAICIDTLFTKRDDLDEIVPVATCTCGHVFHEPCLKEWFQTQAVTYVQTAREIGIPGRHGSPTFSDAPVECPSCRTECYADPESGDPLIYRLYITFDGRSNSAGPSSSPLRVEADRRSKLKEQEVFGLARRAKGLAEEVKGLSADISSEEDAQGALKRADGLLQDLQLSAKANNGIKTYVGGLIVAVNKLRSALEEHPLIQTLKARIVDYEAALREVNNQMRIIIPNEIRKAKEAEQKKADKKIKKALDELEVFQRELEREKVARKAGRKDADERAKENEKTISVLEKRIDIEIKEKEDLQATLRERGKLLKQYQAKNESRKVLKARVQELEDENARLRSNAEAASQRPPPETSRHSSEIVYEGDSSVREIPASSMPQQSSRHRPTPTHPGDESSLYIDMPSSEDDSRLTSPKRKASDSRLHPTARTFAFDIDEGPKRRKAGQSKYFSASATENDLKEREKKGRHRREGGDIFDSDVDDDEVQEENTSLVISKVNPFAKKQGVDSGRKLPTTRPTTSLSDVLVPATSPPTQRSARNISPISAVASPSQRKSTSTSRRPLGEMSTGISITSKSSAEKEKGKGVQKSMVDFLGMKDTSGRPKAGVNLVLGRQVKKRL